MASRYSTLMESIAKGLQIIENIPSLLHKLVHVKTNHVCVFSIFLVLPSSIFLAQVVLPDMCEIYTIILSGFGPSKKSWLLILINVKPFLPLKTNIFLVTLESTLLLLLVEVYLLWGFVRTFVT